MRLNIDKLSIFINHFSGIGNILGCVIHLIFILQLDFSIWFLIPLNFYCSYMYIKYNEKPKWLTHLLSKYFK